MSLTAIALLLAPMPQSAARSDNPGRVVRPGTYNRGDPAERSAKQRAGPPMPAAPSGGGKVVVVTTVIVAQKISFIDEFSPSKGAVAQIYKFRFKQ